LNSEIDKTENPFSVSKAQKFCGFSRNVLLDVGKIVDENLLDMVKDLIFF